MPETKKIVWLRVDVSNFVILQQKTIFNLELKKLLKAYLRIASKLKVICILLS